MYGHLHRASVPTLGKGALLTLKDSGSKTFILLLTRPPLLRISFVSQGAYPACERGKMQEIIGEGFQVSNLLFL
jgi:hypothetical protein